MAKLILTHEVTGLGEPGEIVEVKDGYARNYLLPRKLATPWSAKAEKQVVAIRKARKVREIASVEDAWAVRDRLAERGVVVTARAGATGRLFGTVTGADIAEAVKADGGPELDKRKIEVPAHIKSVGEYQVTVKLHADVTAKLTVTVRAE